MTDMENKLGRLAVSIDMFKTGQPDSGPKMERSQSGVGEIIKVQNQQDFVARPDEMEVDQ